ncbi:MAG: hypothetical protein VKQ33_15840, partial [Candidatus Sericytochromatia bacterium]|nr:hypothetical protein [Candidatus Sericytochromatia bacterium]
PDQRRVLAERLLSLAEPRPPAGWRRWRQPVPRPPTGPVLVLAAGLLLTARTSLSRTLVTRVVGRGRDPAAVQAALRWLEEVGLLVSSPPRPGVLTPTPAAVALLQGLGVAALQRHPHNDVALPAHLTSLLASAPEALPPPVQPAAAAPVQPPPLGCRRRSRAAAWLAGLAGLAGAITLGWGYLGRPPTPHPALGWRFQLERLAAGGGTLLHLDHAGLLLSLQDGALYRSAADRLDYKRPVAFSGFDMAADCSLIAPRVQAAVQAPGGRFLWVELAGSGGPERCLVDLETRTVTHDAGRSLVPAQAPHVVGWLSPTELGLAAEAPPRRGPWQAVDVTGRVARLVAPPRGRHLLWLAAPGPASHRGALAWHAEAGTWWLALDSWREGAGFVDGPRCTLRGFVPAPDAVPRSGAISGDGRLLLLTWSLPVAAARVLTLTTLPAGETVVVPTPTALVAEAPVFWAPRGTAPDGQRFFVTLAGPRGPEPTAVAVRAALREPQGGRTEAPSGRQAGSPP